MTEPKRAGGLEINQDVRFQDREWKVQRGAWVIMLLIILLALLGLFGTGPISSGDVEAGDGSVAVGYERFVRHDGRTTLTVEVEGSQVQGGEIQVWVSRDYIDAMEVQQITPNPADTVAAGDRLMYTFPVDDSSSSLVVSFSLRPKDMGRLSGEAGVSDGSSVSWTQLSYP